MNYGIFYDIPDTQYHAETGLGEGKYCTRSMVSAYIDCPASFKCRYIDRHPLMQFNGNKGTSFGTFFECYLLDRDIKAFAKKPTQCWSRSKGELVPWNLRAGQFVHDLETQTTKEWEAEHPTTYSDEDMELAQFVEARFSETALGKWWVSKIPESKKQVTVRWQDEATGLPMQIRIDNYLAGSFLCDLKTTAKSIDRFSDVADAYGYHIQDAMYTDAMALATGERLPFLFAICETTGLKRAGIRQLHPVQVAYARSAYKDAINGIAAGNYEHPDATETTARQCDLPAYLLYKYETEE